MRKPHEQMRWLLLVGLGFCLVPQNGPGQLPTVENRPPVRLGAPQEVEKALPQVLEFAPAKPPLPNAIVFDVVKPPVPARAPPITTTPMVRAPLANETEPPPEFDPFVPLAKPEELAAPTPFPRPTFGPVIGIDIDIPIVSAPSEGPSSTLVYWTNDPIQIMPDEKTLPAVTTVEFEAPVVANPLMPLEHEMPLNPGAAAAYPFYRVESEAMVRARLLHQARARQYMDHLGSADGTPRIVPRHPQYFATKYQVPIRYVPRPQRRIDGVLHWAVYSGASVREAILWPLRYLADPLHYFE